ALDPVAHLDGGDLEQQVAAFCGACHAVPRPGSFPKAAWPKEVAQGFDFYRESGRSDLQMPPQAGVVAWFESRAPEGLPLPWQYDADEPQVLALRQERWPRTGSTGIMEISHLQQLHLQNDQPPVLVYCDMFSGEVGWIRPEQESASPVVLAWLSNPCHVAPC